MRTAVVIFLCLLSNYCFAQADSTKKADSAKVDTIGLQQEFLVPKSVVNRYVNFNARPVAALYRDRQRAGNYLIFYILSGILLLFGILKTVFDKYFSTLFRVFFNTTLRQTQLIEQLQQNKLASLFFNIFFCVVSGLYLAMMFKLFGLAADTNNWLLFFMATVGVMLIYFVKFFVIAFAGWITGNSDSAGVYIFNVFLINKVIGICLLPVLLVIAFADKQIAHGAAYVSLIVIGFLLLMRFIRSFSFLQHKLKFNFFHFFIYVFSLEVLPVMLIYKAVVQYLNIM